MKNRLLALIFALLLLTGCSGGKKSLVIGVSQCSEDIWRTKLNAELQASAHFYGNVDVRFASADDDSGRQIAQIGQFVKDGVDLLIVSPNQVNTITPAVEAAFDAGIPVILFDRKIDSDKYTAFIGADNVEIGRILGNYAAKVLGGKGRIVEIQGLEGSSPAIDRHNGFAEALEAYPGISVVASRYGGWLQEGGARAMQEFLEEGIAFDAVFAQNDRMARGAYEVLPDPAGIPFFGIDALADGIQDVIDGVLTATYLYPTSGDQVMEIAMHILSGEPFERENRLESLLVDGQNARMQLIQEQVTARQLAMVEDLNDKQDEFLLRMNTQRLVLWLLLALIAVLIGGTVLAVRSYYITRKLSQQLEESTKAKLEFFTSVSHDLRTPLSLVSAPLDRVMADDMKPAQKQTLQVVRRNVDVLLRLVNNILDFRKIESGAFPLTLTRFDLCAAVKEWMSGFEEATRNKDLRFVGPEFLEVEADMHLMERSLFNLLSNAFKHTEEGAHIQVKVAQDGADVLLSVEDDGNGIDADQLPKIFEQFYQGRNESSGTGIGLALVRSIAQLHGGSVDVQS
ncbi:MAG: substrate-binding domain-containing protein, partial [Bacteroidales bacterium]|nr:substrate-binding domain-containing protein [Bacteroidales bacterium]